MYVPVVALLYATQSVLLLVGAGLCLETVLFRRGFTDKERFVAKLSAFWLLISGIQWAWFAYRTTQNAIHPVSLVIQVVEMVAFVLLVWYGFVRADAYKERMDLVAQQSSTQGILDAVVIASRDPILVKDDTGLILQANPAAQDAFGGKPLKGRNIMDLIADPEAYEPIRRELHVGVEVPEAVVNFKTACNRVLPMRTRFTVLSMGNRYVYAIRMSDVEGEVEANAYRNNLISAAAHEFRTPVTAIKGYGQLVERKLEEGATKVMVGKIVREADELTNMIGSMLQYDHSQKGENLIPCRSRFDLGQMLWQQVARSNEIHGTDRVKLEANPEPVPVNWDRQKMSQVLGNLLDNALHYADGEVTVRYWADGDKKTASFAVEDKGQGIPPEAFHKIFSPFYRYSDERAHGMGMGLPISRAFVRAHGGDIEVRSTPGQGATFIACVPSGTQNEEE